MNGIDGNVGLVQFIGHYPCVFTPDDTAHDQIFQALPLCICILQGIKN